MSITKQTNLSRSDITELNLSSNAQQGTTPVNKKDVSLALFHVKGLLTLRLPFDFTAACSRIHGSTTLDVLHTLRNEENRVANSKVFD